MGRLRSVLPPLSALRRRMADAAPPAAEATPPAADDARAALASLRAIERSARVVATDAAILVGTAHHSLQSVCNIEPHCFPQQRSPPHGLARRSLRLGAADAQHGRAHERVPRHGAARSRGCECQRGPGARLHRALPASGPRDGQGRCTREPGACPLSSHGSGCSWPHPWAAQLTLCGRVERHMPHRPGSHLPLADLPVSAGSRNRCARSRRAWARSRLRSASDIHPVAAGELSTSPLSASCSPIRWAQDRALTKRAPLP